MNEDNPRLRASLMVAPGPELIPARSVATDVSASGADAGDDRRKEGRRPDAAPRVTIFGAGVAGLSAAHELIERGFDVQVVEPATSAEDEHAVEVGGLACNQFGRVPTDPFLLHDAHAGLPREDLMKYVRAIGMLRSDQMQPVQRRFPTPERIGFCRTVDDQTFEVVNGTWDPHHRDDWGVSNYSKLRAVADTLRQAYLMYRSLAPRRPGDLPVAWYRREILFVEVRGHTNADDTEAKNRQASLVWAREVIEELIALNAHETQPIPEFAAHLTPVGVGSQEPLGDLRDARWRRRSNRVEFRIVEQLIPGEHGYRFFPAFYRHLFDTMRRTPILDRENHATGETAHDRLVPTLDLGLALGDGRPPAQAQTRHVRSLEEFRGHLRLLLERIGVTVRDIARFEARLIKFLTSSAERREKEYENQSWWTFIGGDDPHGYSPTMSRHLMQTSQALVAMNARETDARSQGNVVSQLLLHYAQNQVDFTLNGPTSEVWLRIWKRYLVHQGVRFFVGELGRLRWKDLRSGRTELLPVTTHGSGWLNRPAAGLAKANPFRPRPGAPAEPLVPRPGQNVVRVVVIGAADEDYSITIQGTTFCHSAVGQTARQIAENLAEQVNAHPLVSARAHEDEVFLRILLLELDYSDSSYLFADAASERALPKAFGEEMPTASLQDAATRLDAYAARWRAARDEGKAPLTAVPLDEADWALLGHWRMRSPEFDRALSALETDLALDVELTPKIELDKKSRVIRLMPSARVSEGLMGNPDGNGDPDAKHPYSARVTATTSFRDPDPLWIKAGSASGLLRIVGDPVAEDPNHVYLSAAVDVETLRPDFYVLAVPFERASSLVWAAEADRPGLLHGCLAEVLRFDRRSGRRTAAGDEARLIRDPYGRPPLEYPLRDFAGIQYYFRNNVRIGKGHTYYPHAEWGLSSISQLAYWRERLSPAGPFMGQLSVDIGNFYNPAQARFGERFGRSGWNSRREEIAAEVWFQVRQGLERDRANSVAAPAFYHLDEGILFVPGRGATFREELLIEIRLPSPAPAPPGPYTVWLGEERFTSTESGSAIDIAGDLAAKIRKASCGSIGAAAMPHGAARDGDDTTPEMGVAADVACLLVRSTLPQGSALVVVTRDDGGRHIIRIANRTYMHVPSALAIPREPADGRNPDRCRVIRDGLLEQLLRDADLSVVARASGQTGIALLPRGAGALPPIEVWNDGQGLDLTHGPTIRARLDQCNGFLQFAQPDRATVSGNASPFLINVPGQWTSRPGVFDPQEVTFDERVLRPDAREQVRYKISNRRWVAAGTYMATCTRLTTMESANESARHAVNAVIRCLARDAGRDEYNAQGRVFADLAEIWDPEQNELDDLEPLKRLDRKLVQEGLPHVMDILKITDAIDAMPMHGNLSRDPLANILHLVQHAMRGDGTSSADHAGQGLADLLGQMVERAHDVLDPTGLLRDLKGGSGHLAERLKRAVQSFMTDPAGGTSSTTSGV